MDACGMAVSNTSQTDRQVIWAAPKDSYWEWIRTYIQLPNVVDLDAMAIRHLAPDPMQQTLSPFCIQGPAPIWIQGIDGRYEAEWPSWLANVRKIPPQAAPAKKVSKTTKGRRTSKKALASSPDAAIPPSSDLELAVILGEAWTGHRRTFPLPEGIVPFYWYELFDRILPWLSSLTLPSPTGADTGDQGAHSSVLPRDMSRLSPRVIDWIQHAQVASEQSMPSVNRWSGNATTPFILVVAESFATSQMWQSLLERWDVSFVLARPTELRMQATPDVVLVDLDIPPRASRASQNAELAGLAGERAPAWLPWTTRLRQRFPTAMLAFFDPFPRWGDWQSLQEQGVDALFPKPFSTFGVRWCIQRWIEQGIAGTIVPSSS
jgi:hypothetical protein